MMAKSFVACTADLVITGFYPARPVAPQQAR
jgi:hypothetical protein